MTKKLTTCLLLHILEKVEHCRCDLNDLKELKTNPQSDVNFNCINQEGNANITGTGEVEYKNSDRLNQEFEELKKENELLKELLSLVKNRDK